MKTRNEPIKTVSFEGNHFPKMGNVLFQGTMNILVCQRELDKHQR